MSWDYRISERALKELRKLGVDAGRRILDFLDARIRDTEDPRKFGKGLCGELGEFWRYRVGDYRVLCKLEDGEWTVLVVKVGHRREVYR